MGKKEFGCSVERKKGTERKAPIIDRNTDNVFKIMTDRQTF